MLFGMILIKFQLSSIPKTYVTQIHLNIILKHVLIVSTGRFVRGVPTKILHACIVFPSDLHGTYLFTYFTIPGKDA